MEVGVAVEDLIDLGDFIAGGTDNEHGRSEWMARRNAAVRHDFVGSFLLRSIYHYSIASILRPIRLDDATRSGLGLRLRLCAPRHSFRDAVGRTLRAGCL